MGMSGKVVTDTAAVYFSGVLEYMTAELLELGGNAARDDSKKVIEPRHLALAIGNDEELCRFAKNATLMSAGVMPNIHRVLLTHSEQMEIYLQDKDIDNDEASYFLERKWVAANQFDEGGVEIEDGLKEYQDLFCH